MIKKKPPRLPFSHWRNALRLKRPNTSHFMPKESDDSGRSGFPRRLWAWGLIPQWRNKRKDSKCGVQPLDPYITRPSLLQRFSHARHLLEFSITPSCRPSSASLSHPYSNNILHKSSFQRHPLQILIQTTSLTDLHSNNIPYKYK